MTNADRRDYTRALAGLDYPASRDAIVRKAADHGGLDTEVLYILENLSEDSYDTEYELQQAIDGAYEETNGLSGGTPAAPADPDVKRDTARAAETDLAAAKKAETEFMPQRPSSQAERIAEAEEAAETENHSAP